MKKLFAIVMVALLCSCQPKTVQKDGGVIIDLEIGDSQTSTADIAKTADIIKKRVELFCTSNPIVIISSRNVHIEMPLINDTNVCKTLLFQKGEFEIMESYEAQNVLPYLAEINTKLVENKNYDLKFPSDSTKIKDNPLFNLLSINETMAENGVKQLQRGPAVGLVQESDTALMNAIFNHKELSILLPRNLKFKWSKERRSEEISLFMLIATKTRGISSQKLITSDMIMDSKIDDRGGRPEIMITLKPEFHQRWARITGENISLSLPMLFDNNVVSYPTVADEIKGGKSSISGNFSVEEAKAMVAILKFGVLPTKVSVKKFSIVFVK